MFNKMKHSILILSKMILKCLRHISSNYNFSPIGDYIPPPSLAKYTNITCIVLGFKIPPYQARAELGQRGGRYWQSWANLIKSLTLYQPLLTPAPLKNCGTLGADMRKCENLQT